jgi:rod shape determining protein RodA
MTTPSIQPASEPPSPLVPREWRLRLDPLLLLASLGLVAVSLVVLKGATASDVPGAPLYYVERQAIYAVVGLVLMYGISRADYSRLRELRYPLYLLLIGLLLAVLAIATATRGARSWIPLPGFHLQPSELGKILLLLAARRRPGSCSWGSCRR